MWGKYVVKITISHCIYAYSADAIPRQRFGNKFELDCFSARKDGENSGVLKGVLDSKGYSAVFQQIKYYSKLLDKVPPMPCYFASPIYLGYSDYSCIYANEPMIIKASRGRIIYNPYVPLDNYSVLYKQN